MSGSLFSGPCSAAAEPTWPVAGELLIDQSIEPVKAIIVAIAVQMVELVLDEIDLNNLSVSVSI